MLDNQNYLKEQIGQSTMITGAPNMSTAGDKQGSDIKNRRKYALGGMMNPEEAKMNRALLQEIARVKHGEAKTLERLAKNPI